METSRWQGFGLSFLLSSIGVKDMPSNGLKCLPKSASYGSHGISSGPLTDSSQAKH